MDETDTITTLSCGHGQCKECWDEYLKIKVKERCKSIKCPGMGCGLVLDENIIKQLLDSSLLPIFNETLARSFVEKNPNCIWCPTPDCGYAVLLNEKDMDKNEMVLCYCGNCFWYYMH